MRSLVLAAAAAACPVAVASEATAQTVVENLSAAELFEIAERTRAAGRSEDALAIYDALSRDPDAEVRAEARFRRGMTLAEAKRYREAAESFRALLDERPNAARVRLELGRVLALLGDEKAARQAIRQAQAAGLPEDVAVIVDQFAAALRSTKPWGGSLELALAPDTNVNRATSARTLDTVIAPFILSQDARARSGVGVKAGAQVYARVPVGDKVALIPRLSGLGRFYRASRFDDMSLAPQLGLEWRSKRDRVTGSVGAGWRWYGMAPYARTATAGVDWIHAADRTTQLVAHAGVGRARYFRNALQDGGLYDVSLSAEHAVTPGSGATLTLSADRQTARDAGYSTTSGGVALLGWKELGKVTAYLSGGLRRTEGDAPLALFGDRRREWLYQVSAGATFRQVTYRGLAPTFRLTFERNVSTIGLYDYRRLGAEAGLTRAF